MPNTIDIPYDGVTKTLNQITEGNNQSVYLLRESTREFRLNIRHSKEKASGNAVALDRHNLEISVRTFPTADLPLGKTETVYAVIRGFPDSDGTDTALLANCMATTLSTNRVALINWQTTP